MSERPLSDPTPLGKFLDQYSKDLEARVSRTLDEYLKLFPGDTEHVAEEFLALSRFREPGGQPWAGSMPQQVSHYRIVKELGRGGQGVVYLAKDLKLGREVAIKMLRRTRLALTELERLEREARIASRLDHPGICPIYDIGDHGGEPYVVMRYVRGTSLSQRLEQLKNTSSPTVSFVDVYDTDRVEAAAVQTPSKPETPREPGQGPPTPSGKELNTVLRLIEQVARALHEAHEAQIVHRDVKPGNIIVTPEGQPVLLDFGVATMVREGDVAVTRTGETPGTPPYMSPEQTSGKRVHLDRRTDIYSLGVTLYECLTLRRPFGDTTDFVRQILFVPVPDPRTLNPAISKDLKIVIDTALEKDRDRRYATAAEFADDLRRVRDREPIRARPIGVPVRLMRWVQRHPAVAASVISIIAILTTALILVTASLREASAARDAERAKHEELQRANARLEPLGDLKLVLDLGPWSDDLWPSVPSHLDGPEGIKAWLEEARALENRREKHEAALRALEGGTEETGAKDHVKRINVLTDLVGELSELPAKIREMERRRDSASTLEARTILSQDAEWEDVKNALAADARFASIGPLKPQLGLIPIGKNEAGLYEFAVAETGRPMKRGGEWAPKMVGEGAPAILVLLPGGTLKFDPEPDVSGAMPDPANLVATQVPPFFLGKHEVTQAQWRHVMRSNPALVQSGTAPVPVTELHPVENVTWKEADRFCRRAGVRLPTQDEWEIAARSTAGAEFGDCDQIECLETRENLSDLTYIEVVGRNPPGIPMNWRDRFPYHAPVGSFRANGFGIHDMLGNVSELCSDRYSRQRIASAAAATRPADPAEQRRVNRGSNWQEGAREASCRRFRGIYPESMIPFVGVRIARSFER
jgi:serine/threonine protein kinase/formylglycine-generating enzyme required for sulfatase activity